MKKSIAIGCFACLLVTVVLIPLLGQRFQRAAQRRTFGRGSQTIVELLWRSEDLFDDLATANGDMSNGLLTLEADITLKYAGPYAIVLRTASAPDNPLPPSSILPNPIVSVAIDPPNGPGISQTVTSLASPFWSLQGPAGFTLSYFDAPGLIPLDQAVHIRVEISKIPDEFAVRYGPEGVIAVRRSSSE